MQSDGSIQNKYELKILNKTDNDMQLAIRASGHDNMQLSNIDGTLSAPKGKVIAYTIYLRIPGDQLKKERIPVTIRIEDKNNQIFYSEYESMFFGPKR